MPLNVGGSVISKEMGNFYSRLSVAGNYVTDGLVLYLDAGVSNSYYGYWSPSLSNGASAFDGNLSTVAGTLGGTAGPFTYTFTNPPQVTTARMYVTFGATSAQVGSTTDIFLVNGIDVTQKAKTANLYLSAGWIDVTEETGGTWNTFQFKNVSAVTNAGIYAIEINGDILIGNYDGTTWNDLSGNEYNGTLVNGPAYNNGNGGHFNFDYTDDYVTTTGMANYSYTNGITVSVWYYNGGGTGSYRGVVTNGTVADRFGGFDLRLGREDYFGGANNGTRLNWRITNSGGTATSRTIYANINEWHNYVGTYNNSTVAVYKDGTLFDSTTLSGGGQLKTMSDSTTIARSPGTSEYLDGKLAIVKIYNRALSATEITQNFNATRNRFGI